jgi:ABC-2 type transport system permease protein
MYTYWKLAKVSIQRYLTYRAATIAGLVTNYFFGILRATIFIAFYDFQASVEGITLQGAITYAALGQALIGFLSMFQWYDLMNTVYTGDISSDLLKPINYIGFWMAQDLGRAIVQLMLRGLTLMIGFTLIYDIQWPENIIHFFTISLSLILAWLISFSWRFLVNLSAFWTSNAQGILRFFFVLSWFLSGFLMPLRFFPSWVTHLSLFTPFPHTFNTVIEVYLGIISGTELYFALFQQLLWALFLIAIGQIVLQAGLKRLVILGG